MFNRFLPLIDGVRSFFSRRSLARIAPPIDPKIMGNGMYFVRSPETNIWIDPWRSVQLSAVWSCVRLISETVGYLPKNVMRELAGGGSELNDTHPAARLLRFKVNPEMGADQWAELMLTNALLWGNGYSEIDKDASGRVIAIWPMMPYSVRPARNSDGVLFYLFKGDDGQERNIPADRIFHLKALTFDGIHGISPIDYHARTVGLGITQEQYAAAFFGHGAWPGGFIKPNQVLTEEAVKQWKESFESTHKGAGNAFKVGLLPFGSDWVPVSVDNEKSQALETRKFQVIEICRLFRVPPHKVFDLERATFSNITEQNIEFIQDQMAWVRRFEQECDDKLLGSQPKLFTKINVNALLRGDPEKRGSFYEILHRIGAASINEIRNWEDLNPIPDGDNHFIQANMMPLDRALNPPEPTMTTQTIMEESPEEEPEDEEESGLSRTAETMAVQYLRENVQRVLRKDSHHWKNCIRTADGDHEVWLEKMLEHNEKQADELAAAIDGPMRSLAELHGVEPNGCAVMQIEAYKDRQFRYYKECATTAESALAAFKEGEVRRVDTIVNRCVWSVKGKKYEYSNAQDN